MSAEVEVATTPEIEMDSPEQTTKESVPLQSCLQELMELSKTPTLNSILGTLSDDSNITSSPSPENEVSASGATTSSTDNSRGEHHPWGTGVGYGTSDDCQNWDVSNWAQNQTTLYASMTSCLSRVNEALCALAIDDDVSSTVMNSCLVPFCVEHLESSSLANMGMHTEFYTSLLNLIKNMVDKESIRPAVIDTFECKTRRINLWKTFSSLKKQATRVASLSASDAESVDDISQLIITLYDQTAPNVGNNESTEAEEKEPTQKTYVEWMADMRFDTVETFGAQKYSSNSSGTPNRKLMRRLASEYSDLTESLPLNEESSIFVRVHETNMDLSQFMVIPADDTPYASGCFVFDVYFPSDYPTSPPKVNLATTGGGTIRFNPNLYADGYVCLSLLGTWDAHSDGERWQPNLSTYLQVVISCQSLIFVPDPYWNEPGYENNAASESARNEAKSYKEDKQLNTVKFAMIEQLKNPNIAFKVSIMRHFYLSRERCLRNAILWLGEEHELVFQLKDLLSQLDESVFTNDPKVPIVRPLNPDGTPVVNDDNNNDDVNDDAEVNEARDMETLASDLPLESIPAPESEPPNIESTIENIETDE